MVDYEKGGAPRIKARNNYSNFRSFSSNLKLPQIGGNSGD
jgi:hypothetical protein